MSEQQLQVWVRNDKGQVYGPLSPPSVELLIDNGIIGGRLQVSTNGEHYVFPGRVPGLRMIFPKETWGEQIVPGDDLDAEWSKVVTPSGLPTVGTPPASGGAAPPPGPPPGARGPVSGPSGIAQGMPPGARGPVAGPGARQGPGAPVAGPGAAARPVGNRPANVARPPGGPPVMSSGSGVTQAPVKSSPSVMDFMNNATGTAAPPPSAAPRSSPSVAEIMNSGAPAAASPISSPSRAAPAPARPSGPVPGAQPAARVSQPSAVRTSAPQNLQSLEELGMPPSGAIGSPAPTHLYYIAAAKELTGLLTLTLPDRELQVHFRKGNPEFLDSTHPEDSLDNFLLAQRLATQDQINQAQSQAARFGGDLLPALFGLGLLNPNAVFQHLGQRASQLLFRALTAEQGSFAFDLEDLPPSRAMPLGNKWSIYLDALRRVSAPDLRRRQMNALELPVMKASGRIPVNEVRLTPQETRAYNHFDGARSLAQMARDFPAEADVLMRVAWMLAPLELVSFAGLSAAAQASARQAAPRGAVPGPPPAAVARPAAPAGGPVAPQRPPPPVMSPAPAAPVAAAAAKPAAAPGNPVNMPKPGMQYPGQVPARSTDGTAAPTQPQAAAAPQRPPPPVMKPAAPKVTAAPPATTAEDIKQLQQLYEVMKKGNYFEVLNLKREADANQVKIAYLKAARSYHPDTIPPGAPPELAKVKADLFALIGEANRTLSDQVMRADYIAELDAGGTGSKVDVEKLLKGEELFQKGRVYVQARKYSDALKLFEDAIGCNGDEPEFYAWRGYSKFMAASDKKLVSADATKDIKACIDKNPNVAAAYFFLGYILKTNGDPKAALVQFKKCVALDPKHIDAAREVRSASGK